ncbi:GNAT family N-acetyltransferase [Gracilibacillus sp. S3-1-1]|uniref:GNAT family N-acetyltransferase n=1 Tax=Gracilibacillus pellucidus TaxID=3095368 RepID=A0ACC6M5V5_9BACI|nr:GNAT family N-acetyltransferase [Gracilibacillus sp. S3-1-1]MDX8046192.1 GNAT family N-acetyltransferase [Gracilibacillus sp. S3-1-1]
MAVDGDFYVKSYHEEDWDSVELLYEKLIKHEENVTYWWPGPEDTWDDVHCIFNKGSMIAKGQVQAINLISEDYQGTANHLIYLNIKVDPDWKNRNEIWDILYERLLQRAKLLKNKLPPQFPTKLCVGNYATEVKENSYFESKGFKHFENLYWMNIELNKDLPPTNFKLTNVKIKHWNMNTYEEEIKYLQAENEIWSETPTGIEKLREYKSNPYWTSVTAFYNDEIIGSTMAWKEADENIGTIENVFVKPDWRKCGLASHLIIEGIHHLQNCNLEYIQLLVETKNESALKLYKSIGFEIRKEEKRYWITI